MIEMFKVAWLTKIKANDWNIITFIFTSSWLRFILIFSLTIYQFIISKFFESLINFFKFICQIIIVRLNSSTYKFLNSCSAVPTNSNTSSWIPSRQSSIASKTTSMNIPILFQSSWYLSFSHIILSLIHCQL